MNFGALLDSFAHDDLLKAVLVLIVLDILIGVVAAVIDKEQRFRFDRLGDFLLNDVLGKVFPWFILYAAAKVAPSVDVLGVDLDAIQKAAWGIVVVVLVASLVQSLGQLGLANIVNKVPGLDASPKAVDKVTTG